MNIIYTALVSENNATFVVPSSTSEHKNNMIKNASPSKNSKNKLKKRYPPKKLMQSACGVIRKLRSISVI